MSAKIEFPLEGAGSWESHAMVRPGSAAAFAVALTAACFEAGAPPPHVVFDHDPATIRFWWARRGPDGVENGQASVLFDAEGEAVFLLDPKTEPTEAFQAGNGLTSEGVDCVPLAECCARVKAFLEAGPVVVPATRLPT